jgi:hypothetical protein
MFPKTSPLFIQNPQEITMEEDTNPSLGNPFFRNSENHEVGTPKTPYSALQNTKTIFIGAYQELPDVEMQTIMMESIAAFTSSPYEYRRRLFSFYQLLHELFHSPETQDVFFEKLTSQAGSVLGETKVMMDLIAYFHRKEPKAAHCDLFNMKS